MHIATLILVQDLITQLCAVPAYVQEMEVLLLLLAVRELAIILALTGSSHDIMRLAFLEPSYARKVMFLSICVVARTFKLLPLATDQASHPPSTRLPAA
jgi:hypothetical protein